MRVSAGLPTGMEGLTYPIPFSDPENVIRIAQAAEKFGYNSVWGNDHMTTQNYVRAEFPVPPRFWEPLITYAFVLSETKTIKVGTGILVLPMRHDIVVAGQADRHAGPFRQGQARARRRHRRLSRGVQGAAARRQDRPRRHRRRGPAGAEPAVQGPRRELRRQVLQVPGRRALSQAAAEELPIYVSGNNANNIERTVKWADGWLPAGMHVDRIRAGVKTLREQAEKAGRDSRRSRSARSSSSISARRTRPRSRASARAR